MLRIFVVSVMMMVCLTASHSEVKKLPSFLKVFVVDEEGKPVQGAEVRLFKNREDFDAKNNVLHSGVTNKKGRVFFSKVEPVAYYIFIRKGDKDNMTTNYKTSEVLPSKISTVTFTIK